MSNERRPVGPYVFTQYQDATAADEPYDPRYPAVADLLTRMMLDVFPGAVVEQIGSTAIPGCAGKGVVDMMCVYPTGSLDVAKRAVESLGYQLFLAPDPFPPERPVYVGVVDFEGESYRTHMHLMPEGWPEIETQRIFRVRLKANPALVDEYVKLKRAVLSAGVEDSGAYNAGKNAFIKDVIEGRR